MTKQQLFPYSIIEDIWNAITHGIGVLISLVALVYLIYISSIYGEVKDVISFSIYGFSIILLFLSSTLYHSIRHETTRSIFKRIDHSMIYLLIVGTYTPYVFTALNTKYALKLFVFLVVFALFGIVFEIFFVGKYKKMSTLVYIIMGWLSIFLLRELSSSISLFSIWMLIAGGVVYTIGAIIYAFSNFKYHHSLWHLFVLGAAICHYISIINIL